MMSDEQVTAGADDQPRTVRELVERISREREALEEAVAKLQDEAFVATSGGWSARDHLAHVSAWERRLLGEMQGDASAARLGLDEAAIAAADTDTVNATIHARHKDDSPEQVRAEFRASGEALLSAISGLSDADLVQPVRPEDPNVETLVDLISWDTYRHYPEHTSAILALIDED
jgi:uncharacterized damage-inducible protein DinB